MIVRIAATIMAVAAVMLVVILNLVSPSSATPLGILGVFALIYIICLNAIIMMLIGIEWALRRLKLRRVGLDNRQIYYYSTIVGLAPVILLAIRSVGQLGIYDIVLVVFFEIISCVYIAKQTV